MISMNSQRNSYKCWSDLKGQRLYVGWPYIVDDEKRDEVRLAVRSISDRKFHP